MAEVKAAQVVPHSQLKPAAVPRRATRIFHGKLRNFFPLV